MFTRAFIAALVLLQSVAAFAEPLGPEFEAYVTEVMRYHRIPGIAMAVVKDGQVIYSRGFGYRDLEKKLPVTPDTLFPIASNSKAFATTAFGLLVDRGKASFDAPVRKVLPAFRLSDDYADRWATPRDLMTHRTGVPRHDAILWSNRFTQSEVFDRLQFLEPSASFREKYQYNNIMFMTLGRMIEAISGMPWNQFVRAELLDKLGMRRTVFSAAEYEADPDHSEPYLSDRKTGPDPVAYENSDVTGAAANMHSSVNEMSNWLRFQLGRGQIDGQQIVSQKSIDEVQRLQIGIPSSLIEQPEFRSAGYGLGFSSIIFRGNRLVQHSGSRRGFLSRVAFLPEKGIGVVVLTNSWTDQDPAVITLRVFDELLGFGNTDWLHRLETPYEEPETHQFTPAPLAPETYAGVYMAPGYGELKILKDPSGALYLDFFGKNSYYYLGAMKLKHLANEVFFIDSTMSMDVLKFTFDDDGKLAGLTWALERAAAPIQFKRIGDLPVEENFRAFFTPAAGVPRASKVKLRFEEWE